jgi:hypothetical protein
MVNLTMSRLSKTTAAGYCRQCPGSRRANQPTRNRYYKFAAGILEVTIHALAKKMTNGSKFSRRTIHDKLDCLIDLLPATRWYSFNEIY